MNPNDLIAEAEAARLNAYAPYSGYTVGAAVESTAGRTWAAANVENVSYGLSLCAERVAIAKMVNDGDAHLATVAVVTRDGGTPCGMCLQTMFEFSPDPSAVRVLVKALKDGSLGEYRLSELIPHGFRADLVR